MLLVCYVGLLWSDDKGIFQKYTNNTHNCMKNLAAESIHTADLSPLGHCWPLIQGHDMVRWSNMHHPPPDTAANPHAEGSPVIMEVSNFSVLGPQARWEEIKLLFPQHH